MFIYMFDHMICQLLNHSIDMTATILNHYQHLIHGNACVLPWLPTLDGSMEFAA